MRPTARLSPALLLGTLLLLGACGGGEPGVSRGRPQRLEADVAVAEATIERIEAAGLEDKILRAVEAIRDGLDKNGWVELSDWAYDKASTLPFLQISRPLGKKSDVPFGLDFEREGHPVALLATYARLFAEHGIDLLVVPVPHRLQVYGDAVLETGRQEHFAGACAVHSKMLIELAKRGVEVVNLLPAFLEARYVDPEGTDETLFFRQDPHWTPRGLALAADEIAERVRAFEWFEPGPAREGQDFHVVVEKGVHRFGDPAKDWREPPTVWLQRVLDAGGQPARTTSRESPILLLGDSFAGYYDVDSADLERQLYARLGQKIDVIKSEGFGGSTIWQALQRRGDRMAGKKLAVWVFVFSVLSCPQGRIFDPFE